MADEETGLTLSDLDFGEAEQLEDVLDMSIDEIGKRLQSNKPKVKIIRAIKWLEMRRADPDVTFDDVKTVGIMSAFNVDVDTPKDDAPKNGRRSGRRSASSTDSSPPTTGGA